MARRGLRARSAEVAEFSRFLHRCIGGRRQASLGGAVAGAAYNVGHVCGRFSLSAEAHQVEKRFGAKFVSGSYKPPVPLFVDSSRANLSMPRRSSSSVITSTTVSVD
jgi:hypothetical protein